MEYGQYIKSKYDLYDEATRFFYDTAEVMFKKRTQTFNESTVTVFMTEDPERLSAYRKYGGWKTLSSWIALAVTDDFRNYFEVLKKYSLLREYAKNGYDVSKIVSHKNFELFSAQDIYRLIRGKCDRIQTVIMTNTETEVLNSKITETLLDCMETPDMGMKLPFPIVSDLFRGAKRKSTMAVGMLSNAGKSRFMCKLIAYSTLVLKEKVMVLLNEMTVEEMRYALITTVINNNEFKSLHGVDITKKERELTLGLYKNKKGGFIYRKKNDRNEFIETIEEYQQRVSQGSEEFQKIMQVAKWIENETNGLIFIKDISSAYDDKSLEFEIRKASITLDAKYVFYDTCKNDIVNTGDWAALKSTVTKITELAKELDIFAYLSIQLTDDTNHIPPDELTSNQISNCKAIKHVLHTLLLFKEIDKIDYKKMGYLEFDPDWGSVATKDLDEEKRYYCAVVDKNRFGSKKKILFELDLDTNEWYEVGEFVRK